MKPRKILHPTDYTPCSRPALAEAIALAEQYQAGLVLLHAVDSLGPENLTYGASISGNQPEAYRRQLFDELRHILPPEAHVQVDLVLSEESLITAILRTQAEFQCDLIVMGTHGTRHWFTSSVAEEIVRRAPCQVLVVKEPRDLASLPAYNPTKLHPGHLVEHEDDSRP